jgi:hypothetical protein
VLPAARRGANGPGARRRAVADQSADYARHRGDVAAVRAALAHGRVGAGRAESSPHTSTTAMIRPLRRRHQWIVRGLLGLLIAAAALALTHPAADARMNRLPVEIASGPGVAR